MKQGKLLIISGPSAGVGKDTILRMFLEKHPDWYQPTSTTTRPLRPGEKEEKRMNSVTTETFKKWQTEDKFLETDFHAGHWYGTLREPVEKLLSEGQNVVLRIDVNGSMQIKNQMPEAVTVFIEAESPEALEVRIRERGSETEEQIQSRLKLAKKELRYKKFFDHRVVNPQNRPEEALGAVERATGF
ncbi:guanylate kinase [Candidatus Saccharibacteria bacterium CG10_big_fil_rev_8_21_14_0_10_47_8]|nr:MAG: guanylate kinase [Candidatus Saccharibacteria bacterium CG10_big_fil_rev_8_21_14_0_10_47_8]